ncbi:hypothetical protein TYRP_001201 [Tyrophagus putrescentiae]|nr:hypothetical protein TYRP_001201 [Tyrophagus putrescentiae]
MSTISKNTNASNNPVPLPVMFAIEQNPPAANATSGAYPIEPYSLIHQFNYLRSSINKSGEDTLSGSTPDVMQVLLKIEATHTAAVNYERMVNEAVDQLERDIAATKTYNDNSSTVFLSSLEQSKSSLKEFTRQKEHLLKKDLEGLFDQCFDKLLKNGDESPSDNNKWHYLCLAGLLDAIKASTSSNPEKAASFCSVFKAAPLPRSITTMLAQNFTFFANNIVSCVTEDLQKISRFLFQQDTFTVTRSDHKTMTQVFSLSKTFNYALALLHRLLSSEAFIADLGNHVHVTTMDELFAVLLPFWVMKDQADSPFYLMFILPAVQFVQRHLHFLTETGGLCQLLDSVSFVPALLTAHLCLLHQLSTEPLPMVKKLFGDFEGNSSESNIFLSGSKSQAIALARWLITELWTMLSSTLCVLCQLDSNKLNNIFIVAMIFKTKNSAILKQLFHQLLLLRELYKEDPSQDNSNVLSLNLVKKGWFIVNWFIELLEINLGEDFWSLHGLIDNNQPSKEGENNESEHRSQIQSHNPKIPITEKTVLKKRNSADSSNSSSDGFEMVGSLSNKDIFHEVAKILNSVKIPVQPEDELPSEACELSKEVKEFQELMESFKNTFIAWLEMLKN